MYFSNKTLALHNFKIAPSADSNKDDHLQNDKREAGLSTIENKAIMAEYYISYII